MRLVSKLTLLLMAGICAVLAIDGYLSVQRELDLFDHDMASDAKLFGQALALTSAEVWETQGPNKAIAALERANSSHDHLRIRWVSLSADAVAAHAPAIPLDKLAGLAPGFSVSVPASDSAHGHLYTYIQMGPDRHMGAIEIGESLRAKHEYTGQTIKRIILVVSLTVLLCTVLALVLGAWLVGRPMGRLVARAREIGAGNLEDRLGLTQRDEIGALGREIDSMSVSLLAARERIERESADRLRAEQQLRHADRLATVGTLAAGIAHELGSPLNIVAERANMIHREEVVGDDALDNARIIREQAERMTAIVRQLMHFARRQTTEARRCDVVRLARETIALLRKLATDRGVEIELHGDSPEELQATADREHLQQALTNLVINAVQASPSGAAVTVSVQRREATRPDAQHAEPQSCIELIVADRGDGIPKEQLERVFEPFFTTKDVGEGTGLGLAVTHGIVSDHGGWIEVESEVGEGTRFRVLLPEEEES